MFTSQIVKWIRFYFYERGNVFLNLRKGHTTFLCGNSMILSKTYETPIHFPGILKRTIFFITGRVQYLSPNLENVYSYPKVKHHNLLIKKVGKEYVPFRKIFFQKEYVPFLRKHLTSFLNYERVEGSNRCGGGVLVNPTKNKYV